MCFSRVKRTQVIDDESDYFAADSNTWLSASERDALQKREEELRNLRFASRKDRKITLDFAGRRVVEDTSSVDMYTRDDAVVQAVHYGKKADGKRENGPTFTSDDFGALVNPTLNMEPPKVELVTMELWSNKLHSTHLKFFFTMLF